MMRVFIFTFCIVLLLGVLLLVMPTDAQRQEKFTTTWAAIKSQRTLQ